MMSSPSVPSSHESPVSLTNNVRFARVSLKPGGKKSAQLVYFNHAEDISQAMETIFQEKSFHLPSPKLILALEGGLNNSQDRFHHFDEKQLAASVSRLLLDIGRNKLTNDKTAPWLFTYVRHDPIASRIIQITRQQYLANDFSLNRFVDIGFGACQPLSLENAPHDYQSIINALSYNENQSATIDTRSSSHRILNKRLSRVILYGKSRDDPIDRSSALLRCVDEINHSRRQVEHESVSVPKIVLLYGGEVEHIKSIHGLINVEPDSRKFGLVIIRGSGRLADVLAWIYDKIHGDMKDTCSEEISLPKAFLQELKVLVSQLLDCEIDQDLISLVNYLVLTRCRKVQVCDEDNDLSLHFLEALVAADQSQRLASLKLHLSLAFELNQPKFASRMLRVNQDLPEKDVVQLAKMAIIRDQLEFFHVLEDICGITSDSLGENFDQELSSKMNYNHGLFLECMQQNFGCSLEEVYHSTDEMNENSDDETQSINVKLFLWAVFFDHYNLSVHFWRRLNDRLCGALIAAQVYRLTADLCVTRSSTELVTVEKLRDHAEEYETLAMRLLQALYTSNPNTARLSLKRENLEFNKFSTLDVAIASHCENFIAHICVQEVFNEIWSGEKKHTIKGKKFDRMLSMSDSSFGPASTAILAKDQQHWLKYFFEIKSKLSRPRVKYQLHFLSYLLFLSLLSYLVIFVKASLIEINGEIGHLIGNETCTGKESSCSAPQFSRQSWSVLQILVNVWVFMFTYEEFQQAKSFKTKEIGIGRTFLIYLDESWNKLDCLCIFMYMASIILESFNTTLTLNAARAFLAIDVVLWFIRLLTLLMTDRTVGPMLLMIRAMLHDMIVFFSIFSVFTLAYGVASYSLLKRGQLSLDFSIFRRIFHQAYWHLFGQINDLDAIESDFEMTGWTAFVLLALYMAISNILLVNLLVAMFSNTFDRMYSKMDTLWKFHRYHIIKEYTILSTLPPPLNFFSVSKNNLKPFDQELTGEQIRNLRRREALAYESDVFENAVKTKQSNLNPQERLDLQLQQLRKLVTHVKVTCEASAEDL